MFNIPEKTKEDNIKDVAREIEKSSQEAVENAKVGYKRAFDMLWHTTDDITPQDVCDEFGNNAYKLFENAMKWINLIQQFDPAWVYPPAPYEFTVNEDGTVTIGDLIEVPEE
jgi:adenine specific DNA methylase Mod